MFFRERGSWANPRGLQSKSRVALSLEGKSAFTRNHVERQEKRQGNAKRNVDVEASRGERGLRGETATKTKTTTTNSDHDQATRAKWLLICAGRREEAGVGAAHRSKGPHIPKLRSPRSSSPPKSRLLTGCGRIEGGGVTSSWKKGADRSPGMAGCEWLARLPAFRRLSSGRLTDHWSRCAVMLNR